MTSLGTKLTSFGTIYYHVYIYSSMQVFFVNKLGLVENHWSLDLEVQCSNPSVSMFFPDICQIGDITKYNIVIINAVRCGLKVMGMYHIVTADPIFGCSQPP